jgi:hypothetical protein
LTTLSGSVEGPFINSIDLWDCVLHRNLEHVTRLSCSFRAFRE